MPSGTTPPAGPLSRRVAAYLSAEITRRRLRQIDIAQEAGMSASQLSRALSAQKVFTLDQVDAVCRAVGVSIVDAVTAGEPPASAVDATVTALRVGGAEHNGDRAVAKDRAGDRGGEHGHG